MTPADRATLAALTSELQASRDALQDAATLLRQQNALMQMILDREMRAPERCDFPPGYGLGTRGG